MRSRELHLHMLDGKVGELAAEGDAVGQPGGIVVRDGLVNLPDDLSGALGGGDAHVGPGLGFAMGPVVTGLVTQLTGSLQTGFVVLCGLTGVGVMAGLLYPSSLQRIEAPTGSCG